MNKKSVVIIAGVTGVVTAIVGMLVQHRKRYWY